MKSLLSLIREMWIFARLTCIVKMTHDPSYRLVTSSIRIVECRRCGATKTEIN